MILAVRARITVTLVALPFLAVPAVVDASGFAVESQGARAMGFSGAYVAQAADPTAIYYNAAGIAFLKRKHLYVGAQLGGVSTDFTGEGPFPVAGTPETASRGLRVLPNIYYSQQVGEKTVVGLGVNSPFAFRTSWNDPNRFTGRYICLDCKIQSWAINPTIAYKLADRLAVGAGVDVRLSSFRLNRRLQANPNPFPQPTDVAQLDFENGTSAGVGFNVGLLASPNENFSFGLSYRHKVTISHGATAAFTQIPTGDAVVDAAVKANLPAAQPGTVTFTYPASIGAGIALRRGYWTVEGDFAWTLWSSFDQVRLQFQQTPSFDTLLPENYESTWRGAIGVEYLIADTWEVRAGYSYDHSPQPTPTISPFLHDADRNAFALGGSYKYGYVRLDLVARLVLDRSSSTLGLSRYGYDGTYGTHSFSVGFSLGYRF